MIRQLPYRTVDDLKKLIPAEEERVLKAVQAFIQDSMGTSPPNLINQALADLVSRLEGLAEDLSGRQNSKQVVKAENMVGRLILQVEILITDKTMLAERCPPGANRQGRSEGGQE